MTFLHPRFALFRDDIARVAEDFALDQKKLVVEMFTPNNNVIFVETVAGNEFRIHINLQEKRIVSVRQLRSENMDAHFFQKYSIYMK